MIMDGYFFLTETKIKFTFAIAKFASTKRSI